MGAANSKTKHHAHREIPHEYIPSSILPSLSERKRDITNACFTV
jgi:cbb3-type cytochrome oxidase cytochrome c subunit